MGRALFPCIRGNFWLVPLSVERSRGDLKSRRQPAFVRRIVDETGRSAVGRRFSKKLQNWKRAPTVGSTVFVLRKPLARPFATREYMAPA